MTEPMKFVNYFVNVDLIVTAPSEQEARDALVRSGVREGDLIGECLIQSVTDPEAE
jgi:hypothetical protein